MNPEIAIVVLNWNGVELLQKFLPSVLKSTYHNKRIIVADNASTDNSVEMLKNKFPEVEIVINKENGGFAKGYNEALKKINSEIFVLLNSDVEVSENWIEPVIEVMKNNKEIAACQPKILSYKNKIFFEYAGACGGWIDKFGYPFARGRVFETCEKDIGQYDTIEECFWASGAAMFIRSKDFFDAGGFDEYFFAHQEEIDLCWRLRNKGRKIFVVPASVVYHVGGGTLSSENSRKIFLNFRNNIIMLHKNNSFLKLLWLKPFRLILDIAASVENLIKGKPANSLAIIKANFAAFSWMIKNGSKSNSVTVKNEIGIYNGSIVAEYFLNKKKTFSEIILNK